MSPVRLFDNFSLRSLVDEVCIDAPLRENSERASNFGDFVLSKSLLSAVETDRFQLKDLFFSRTDKRGVILSANEVFRHVSFMEWDELIGAPHKVVRHPLMPRAVFRLLWTGIQSGEPVGAYVVNQAKDKKCYWVYAVVIPTEDGFLSVRLKPTSERLEKVKALYTQLRSAEDNGERSVEESEKALLAATAELDGKDYQGFMTEALVEEMAARSQGLDRGSIAALDSLSIIQTAVKAVADDAQIVTELFERTKQIPYNMSLQASKFEGRDGPIGVISNNHRTLTQQLENQVKEFQSAAQMGAGPIQESLFVAGTATLIEEVVHQFLSESPIDHQRRSNDTRSLGALKARYQEQAKNSVSSTSTRAEKLSHLCKNFKRALAGLELTRIMCKIEQSKLNGDSTSLDEIVSQLLVAEKELSSVIARIEEAVAGILEAASNLNTASEYAA
ncbi:hypothetical protein ACOTTU_19895 [Roseobacter sp. EG26]|uniref:hypothetical protein n=1 Tax=Roseobacter sp. EG26 TaxID=3412477 RepID=UPI003CE5479D